MANISAIQDKISSGKQGYTLTVRETDNPETVDVTLRFLAPPTDEWRERSAGMLARLSCARLEDLPGPLGGKCLLLAPVDFGLGDGRSHSPEHGAAILEDALDHIHNSSPRGNSRAAQGDENSSG